MADHNRMQELLQLYAAGRSTPDQELELLSLLDAGEDNMQLMKPVLLDMWEKIAPDTQATDQESIALADRIWSADREYESETGRIYHRVHFLRTAWFRVAVAVLIILTGIVVYDQFLRNTKTGGERSSSAEVLAKVDILPGSDKAVLTLSDGRKIELNDGASRVINDGELLIKNNDGQLNYGQVEGATHPAAGAGRDYAQDTRSRQHPSEGGDWRASYNTMATPRGGQYKLVLPDGSKVWLNAESSITFPTVFGGSIREVKMTGEAYFEIKADKTKPFIVSFNNNNVEVLGTSFNVNAYTDEPISKTTLITGSVSVKHSSGKIILSPNEQAIISETISVNKKVNVQQILSWKNGLFNFEGQDFSESMRQIARWYDVKIVYDNGIPKKKLWGEVYRDLSLERLIRGLDGTVAHFRLEGRTLHVTP